MSATSPFSLVFDSLWELMDNSPLITALVKEGNKIKFNKDNIRNPLKDAILSNDVPELILVCEGSSLINPHATSCTSQINRRYSWLLSTGDMRVHEHFFDIEWAVFVSMLNWKNTVSPLTYLDSTFAKRCDMLDATNGLSDPERNRGIKGWSAVWRCEIEMHFNTKQLLQLLEEGSGS